MRWGSRLGAGVLAMALAACGGPSETARAPAEPDPEAAAALAALPAPYNAADLANGERKYALCKACHTLVAGGANMTGPNLHGVFGRKAGAVEGYAYSKAMQAADIVWDAPHLETWLTDPHTLVPGSKMSFQGIKTPKDRADLIAYLAVEGARP